MYNKYKAVNKALNRGVTLLELLCVTMILALLLTAAIPSMATIVVKWRSEWMLRDMLHLIQNSKAKAAQQRRAIVICGVAEGDKTHRCQRSWDQKVIAFIDVDNNGHFSDGDALFQTAWPLKGGAQMTLTSNRYRYIIRPNGTLKSTPGSVRFCAKGAVSYARRLVVDRVGRARITPYDQQGAAIAC